MLQDPQIISLLLLGLVILILSLWIWRMEYRLKRLLRGKNAQDLESSFVHITKELDGLKTHSLEIDQDIVEIHKQLAQTLSRFHVLRYNPFKGTGAGGNQSFVVCLLNENGDGITLSSLYSRDRVSIYSKAIREYRSEFELSNEEKEALEKARTNPQ